MLLYLQICMYARSGSRSSLLIELGRSLGSQRRPIDGKQTGQGSEIQILEAASRHGRRYPAGHDLIREGDAPGYVFVVLEGWAYRYKILPGGSRQIISFLIPGDFCDMHVAVLAEMDHSIAALTDATIVTLSHDKIDELTSTEPRLAKAFWWTQLVDEGVLRATIVSMGRRTSLERVAHLLCKLSFRMLNIGIATNEHCEMPFSQIVLSERSD